MTEPTVPVSLTSTPVRIGTRGSELALWQSRHVASLLRQHWGEQLEVELEIITTEGDRIQDRPLHEVGGKGLFVKGIEQRLLDRSVDLAVHSMKDLPAQTPAGLLIACTPKREDPRDALCVGVDGQPAKLETLAAGTRVGTGSLRRGALIRQINPGVQVVMIRGNVPTRLRKIEAGEVDAVILAAAGLRRLGLHDRISEALDVDRFCPAPAQGILALECREDDARIKALLEPLRDPETSITAAAERGFLQRLEAGCTVPVACHARLTARDTLHIEGSVVDPTGDPCFRGTRTVAPEQAERAGRELAEELLEQGAGAIVDAH